MEPIIKNYIKDNNLELLNYYKGIEILKGCKAGQIRNSYAYIKDNVSMSKYYICIANENDDKQCIFLFDELDKLKKIDNINNPIWYKLSNGYIGTTLNNKKKTFRYLHQHLMDYYGQKDSSIKMLCSNTTLNNNSVDHINRNPLDNRLQNLRIINQSHQNINQNNKLRNSNITNIDYQNLKQYIPKNINYVKQATDKNGLVHGEHFSIEIKYTDSSNIKHKLRKKTTKSQSIELPYKLIQALKIKYQNIASNPTLQIYFDLCIKDKLEHYKTTLLDTIKDISAAYNIANNSKLYDLNDTNINFKKKLEKTKCSHCEKEFTGKSSLTRHIKTMHN